MRFRKNLKRISAFIGAILVVSSLSVSVFADSIVNSRNSKKITISSDKVVTIPCDNSVGYETFTLPSSLPEEITARGHFCSFLAFYENTSQVIAVGSSKPLEFSISLTQYIDDYGRPYYPATFIGEQPNLVEYYVLGVDDQWHVMTSPPSSFKLGMFISSYEDIVSGGRTWIEKTSYAQGIKGNGKGFFFGGNTIEKGGIVDNIVEGFTGSILGLSSGVVSAFDEIAVDEEGGLTDFAIWALVFVGVAMATVIIVAVTRKVG